MNRSDARCQECGHREYWMVPWPRLSPIPLAPDAFKPHELVMKPDLSRLPHRPVMDGYRSSALLAMER